MAADLKLRFATAADLPLLAQMNRKLIRDERADNPMSVLQLEERMRGWLDGEYRAVLFERDEAPVAYALFRPDEYGVYLRQFFVEPAYRRSGIGRAAVDLLVEQVSAKGKRVTVETYIHNHDGLAFWRSLGFKDHALALTLSTCMKISGVRVFVRDLSEARRFYAELLDLALKHDGSQFGYCVFEAGGIDLIVEVVPSHAPAEDQALVGRFTGLSLRSPTSWPIILACWPPACRSPAHRRNSSGADGSPLSEIRQATSFNWFSTPHKHAAHALLRHRFRFTGKRQDHCRTRTRASACS